MPVDFTPRLTTERTLALIKPDAVAAGKTEEILRLLLQSGFTIAARRDLKVSSCCDGSATPRSQLMVPTDC